MQARLSRLTLALGLAVACAPALRAETIVLDGSTGAAYDSVGDGWFFAGATPPQRPVGTTTRARASPRRRMRAPPSTIGPEAAALG